MYWRPFQRNTDIRSIDGSFLGDFRAGAKRKNDGEYRHVLAILEIFGQFKVPSQKTLELEPQGKMTAPVLHHYPTDIDMYWRPFQWNTDIRSIYGSLSVDFIVGAARKSDGSSITISQI